MKGVEICFAGRGSPFGAFFYLADMRNKDQKTGEER